MCDLMYHSVGPKEVLRSCLLVAVGSRVPEQHGSEAPLRNRLHAALRSREASVSAEPADAPSFVFTGPLHAELARLFPLLTDERGEAPQWRQDACRAGWRQLLDRDDMLAQLLDLVTHSIFSTNTSRAGSMSERRAVGASWIAPAPNWTTQEVEEAYLHEATHDFLFIDELAYGHFLGGADQLTVNSSIRKEPREMPSTLHSAFVAVELLAWRQRHQFSEDAVLRLHGTSERLRTGALESLGAILDDPRMSAFLAPRMQSLADAARERLNTLVPVTTG